MQPLKAPAVLSFQFLKNLTRSPSNRLNMPNTFAAAASSQNVTLPHIPELYNPNFLDVLVPVVDAKIFESVTNLKQPSGSTFRNPMIDALQASAKQMLTENLAPAYNSTGSPTLDAFQFLRCHVSESELNTYLRNAWDEDSALTLRIIWNLRSIHDGRGEKEIFYRAFGWLYDNHPQTAISNLHLLVEPTCTSPKRKNKQSASHGYWKDLLNILALATVDELNVTHSTFLHSDRHPYTYPRLRKDKDPPKTTGSPAERIEATVRKSQVEKIQAKEKRALVHAQRHEILLRKLTQPKYRALYVAVTRLFADRLAQDLRVLAQLDVRGHEANQLSLLHQISLASKWAPTPHGAHDRHTNIATAIIQVLQHYDTPLIYPSALTNSISPKDEAAILRSFYQRWVLTTLRKVSSLPEPLMSANRWKEIKYNRVASVCMKNNTENFYKHDPDGFQAYLISVEQGKKSISGATLFPHELVAQALKFSSDSLDENGNKYPALVQFRKGLAETQKRVVEAQWKTLIENLRESGNIENALAVCDVSGSMGSLRYNQQWEKKEKIVQPIAPAIALSLVLASLAKPPFNGGFITFSSRPEYVQLDLTQSLCDIVLGMSDANWGMNTDLNAVFTKLLLPLAIKHGVSKEDMIKRLFVFTDMQFDAGEGTCADATSWETNYDAVERAYKEAGYDVPQIVYWDLNTRGRETVEVQAERRGVAMMNGFSAAMMKVFMGKSEEEWESVGDDGETSTVVAEEFNPINVMRRAVMRKSFDGLVVID